MGVFALGTALYWWRKMFGAIHIVVGCWHNVGPVGLDITEVNTPGIRVWLLPSGLKPVYHLTRQPRRFAVFLTHVRRQLSVH